MGALPGTDQRLPEYRSMVSQHFSGMEVLRRQLRHPFSVEHAPFEAATASGESLSHCLLTVASFRGSEARSIMGSEMENLTQIPVARNRKTNHTKPYSFPAGT